MSNIQRPISAWRWPWASGQHGWPRSTMNPCRTPRARLSVAWPGRSPRKSIARPARLRASGRMTAATSCRYRRAKPGMLGLSSPRRRASFSGRPGIPRGRGTRRRPGSPSAMGLGPRRLNLRSYPTRVCLSCGGEAREARCGVSSFMNGPVTPINCMSTCGGARIRSPWTPAPTFTTGPPRGRTGWRARRFTTQRWWMGWSRCAGPAGSCGPNARKVASRGAGTPTLSRLFAENTTATGGSG